MSTAGELYPLDSVLPPIQQVLGQRLGMAALLEAEPNTLAEQLVAIDEIVVAYNQLDASILSYSFRHLQLSKPLFPELPTISSMLGRPRSGTCRLFRITLDTMNTQMQRAEQHQPEPNLAFALWDTATETERLLGGALQAYGLTIHARAKGTPSNTMKDELLDALIEVSVLEYSQGNNTPLFQLAQKQNWFEAKNYDGTYLFSDTIRKEAKSSRIREI